MNEGEIGAFCDEHPGVGAACVTPGGDLMLHGALREMLVAAQKTAKP